MKRAQGRLMVMQIRRRQPGDDAEWLRMRCALWPEAAVFVAARPGGEKLAGFAEVGTRSYADGGESSPVGYPEGWYVNRDLRRHGISQRAHEALGFVEVERAVLYRKVL